MVHFSITFALYSFYGIVTGTLCPILSRQAFKHLLHLPIASGWLGRDLLKKEGVEVDLETKAKTKNLFSLRVPGEEWPVKSFLFRYFVLIRHELKSQAYRVRPSGHPRDHSNVLALQDQEMLLHHRLSACYS